MAIRPHIDYTLKQQYILTQIKTTPDSILVSGPSTCIDTLQYISTIPIELKKLHKNTSFQLDLVTQPNLSLQTTSIKVELEIEQYTETKRTCPIIVTNAPDSLNIRLFPSQVQISYAVGLSQYDQIKDQDFVFSVEFPKNSETTYLEVKATKIPSCIQNLSYSPKKIEYILEKK